MKILFLAILLFLCSAHQAVVAQMQDDILVQKKGLGFIYYQNGRQISKNQLLRILENDPAARQELRKGHRNTWPATLLRLTGGMLISYPMGKQLAGREPNWLLSGAGAGLLTFSLPFSGARMKREHQAIYVYNGGTDDFAARSRPDVRFGYTWQGATLAVVF